MNRDDAENPPSRHLASSPCMMHELDEAEAADASSRWDDVEKWRRAERKRQLRRRMAMDAELQQRYAEAIAQHIEAAIGDFAGLIVSCYWPIRGEPDLRPLMGLVSGRGGRSVLPVVTERERPLKFFSWKLGEPLERGFWNIPVPAGGDELVPDIVIAPLVAFDRACFRLGYGGGYFDRTLSGMTGHRRAFGVGYSMAEVETIFPQAHDIPMNAIVTESGVQWRRSE